MDAALLKFQQDGLVDATNTIGRDVAINMAGGAVRVFTGPRSEVAVDPGQAQVGGFRYTRAFSIRLAATLPDGSLIVDLLKPGMSGTDDRGISCKVLRYDFGLTSVRYFFGSVNA